MFFLTLKEVASFSFVFARTVSSNKVKSVHSWEPERSGNGEGTKRKKNYENHEAAFER